MRAVAELLAAGEDVKQTPFSDDLGVVLELAALGLGEDRRVVEAYHRDAELDDSVAVVDFDEGADDLMLLGGARTRRSPRQRGVGRVELRRLCDGSRELRALGNEWLERLARFGFDSDGEVESALDIVGVVVYNDSACAGGGRLRELRGGVAAVSGEAVDFVGD